MEGKDKVIAEHDGKKDGQGKRVVRPGLWAEWTEGNNVMDYFK
jgi:hypothetical protein